MKKLSIISRSLSKISHKRYELYVISRIIHLLDDPTIQFHFQQYVRRDVSGKFALIDLYLPQFKVAIEVDELYHLKQLTADEKREKDIQEAVGNLEIHRVDCSKGIKDVNKQIDAIVKEIIAKKKAMEAAGLYKDWDGLSGYDHYMKTLVLDVLDSTELASPKEICNCFGCKNYAQGGARWWTDPKDPQLTKYRIWYPTENYENSNGQVKGTWYNKMVIDKNGSRILETNIASVDASRKHCEGARKVNEKRIVFYAKKGWSNEKFYNFVGVCKLADYTEDITISGQTYKACVWIVFDSTFTLPSLDDYRKAAQQRGLQGYVGKSDSALLLEITRKINKNVGANKIDKDFEQHIKAIRKIDAMGVNRSDYINNRILPEWRKIEDLLEKDDIQGQLSHYKSSIGRKKRKSNK